jgi:uncharacterized protein
VKKYCLLIVLLLSVAISPLFAQSDSPATREDVLKLFDVMNIRDQMRTVMESVAKQQRSMIHDAMRKRSPQISEEELSHMDQSTSDLMKDLPIDGMIDDMIPVYQKYLTRSDVEAMSAFYSSATGQKLLRQMPAMTTESMQAAAPRIQAMMDKVMDRAEKMTKDEGDKKTMSPAPTTQKK